MKHNYDFKIILISSNIRCARTYTLIIYSNLSFYSLSLRVESKTGDIIEGSPYLNTILSNARFSQYLTTSFVSKFPKDHRMYNFIIKIKGNTFIHCVFIVKLIIVEDR